ncbi:hypothetical protein [Natrinema soli]|uniref:Uncharacterized protein n=1 Tax=Natrinema soli TaxID=1930624 RepID=A0ABD5T2R4_9EURY|nr:hypothetical protein [Natrinema soli]
MGTTRNSYANCRSDVEDIPDDDLERISETHVDGGGEFLGDSIVAMGGFRPNDETD